MSGGLSLTLWLACSTLEASCSSMSFSLTTEFSYRITASLLLRTPRFVEPKLVNSAL